MQIERFFSSKLGAVIASFVIAACLSFSAWPYDTAGGFSTASVSSPVSNTASKGDRLTSRHPNASARVVTRPEDVTANGRGKIPVGCETASSKLAHRADLSARRCIT
jgi:hypothetical protein